MLKDYLPDWDIYMCHIEESPAVIGLDLNLKKIAPLKEKPNAIYINVYLNNPRDDGFPQQEEFTTMGIIEDSLVAQLQATLDAHFVGRTYSNGIRDFYFYTRTTQQYDTFIAEAMMNFPNYRYDYGIKKDDNWELYFDFLFPDVYEFQRIQNRKILRILRQHGDVAERERPIEHCIHFKNEADKIAYWEYIKQDGFALTREGISENSEYPYKLCICRNDKASDATIDTTVMRLWQLAQQVNAEYNGWETSIVK